MKGNHLPFDVQCAIVHDLAEDASIRTIERKTGVHRDTVMRLGHRAGTGCTILHDEIMRELPCKEIQIDELHSFCGKKQRNTTPEEDAAGLGDRWTYVAIDPVSKVVPSFVMGKRDFTTTYRFGHDLASRLAERVQLTSDGMNEYIEVVLDAFGDRVDYAMLIKKFTHDKSAHDVDRKYSPPRKKKAKSRRRIIIGDPDYDLIGTSHVESHNLTMRTFIKRLTRLTVCYSKKPANMDAAIALYMCYHNLCKKHDTLRMTPMMALGKTKDFWSIEDLVGIALDKCPLQENTSPG